MVSELASPAQTRNVFCKHKWPSKLTTRLSADRMSFLFALVDKHAHILVKALPN